MPAAMKLLGVVTFGLALLVIPRAMAAGEPLSTERHVHGVITSVEPSVVAIASTQRTVIGKIDPARTKVTINGKPGTLADLRVTAHAKAELCLDDVWISIAAH